MTVLVLTLSVPVIAGSLTNSQLSLQVDSGLQALLPDIVGYILSFLLLAIVWVSHHSVFHSIQRMNRPLLWLNIMFLLTIGFVPFSTALLGRYPGVQAPVIVYGANIVAISIGMLSILWYAARAKMLVVGSEAEARTIDRIVLLWRLGPIIYGGAIAVSFINPLISVAIYGISLAFYVLSSSIGFSIGRFSRNPKT